MENKLKVGDIVVAKRDEYGITNKSNGWIGKILSFNEYGRFTAKTLKDNSGHTNDIFYGLETDCFELASEEENKLLEFDIKLANILELHLKWLRSEKGGVRADLSDADLSRANLRGADLSRANLRGADLSDANLSDANLSRADLSDANLSRADLSRADLSDADLSDANLSDANLSRADLSRAEGVLSSIDFMNEHFEKIDEGYIAYKTFGTFYSINPNWKIKVGEVIEENVNFDRNNECGCGINVATYNWIKTQTGDSPVYKVLIRNEWLMGVCVPYLSDGKIRCERVEILGVVDD